MNYFFNYKEYNISPLEIIIFANVLAAQFNCLFNTLISASTCTYSLVIPPDKYSQKNIAMLALVEESGFEFEYKLYKTLKI